MQKNIEVAHLRQRLLDTTSCDALADDEPLILGKDAPPRWGKCRDPLLQATAENETIYSSFTAQILGANQEYQTKKHRINWSYEKSTYIPFQIPSGFVWG